jgi:diguanylate cyclase (GGDEF)-like protein
MQVTGASELNSPHRSNLLNIVALCGAIAVFIGLSGWLLPIATAKIFGAEVVLDKSLSAALLLNIALILLIWRGSHALSRQMKAAIEAQREVDIVAVKDYATGLLNRPGIAEKIEQRLRAGDIISLINLDLDNFKKVNDLYGHLAGDELLTAVAERLVRATPDNSECARLGGDEFAILLCGEAASRKNALAIAKKIQKALWKTASVGGGITKISASIGIYAQIEGDSNIADVFRRSDIAMYEAKKAGGERISCFEDIMEVEVQRRYKMEAEIREGTTIWYSWFQSRGI